MGSNLRVTTLNCYEIKTSLSTVVDLYDEIRYCIFIEILLFSHELCV